MLDAHFAGATIVSVAIAIIALTGLIQALRLVRLAMLHKTLRRIIDAGLPIDIDLLDRALGDRPRVERGLSDLRNGSLLLALALACAFFALVQTDSAIRRMAFGVGAFPLLVGSLMTVWGGITLRRQRD